MAARRAVRVARPAAKKKELEHDDWLGVHAAQPHAASGDSIDTLSVPRAGT
jgi:hypothetical protein